MMRTYGVEVLELCIYLIESRLPQKQTEMEYKRAREHTTCMC